MPPGPTWVQGMSRLPHSMHHGFGGKFTVPQREHFCITSVFLSVASQNGFVWSVIYGSGVPLMVLVMVSTLRSEHDRDATARVSSVGNSAETGCDSDLGIFHLARTTLAADLRDRFDERHEAANRASGLTT